MSNKDAEPALQETIKDSGEKAYNEEELHLFWKSFRVYNF